MGDANSPEWVLANDGYLGDNWAWQCAPAVADIDADGDLDLFVGNAKGQVHFYRNDGNVPASPGTHITDTYGALDVQSDSSIAMADIDADGDLDMFVGYYDPYHVSGSIRFYQNDGSLLSPSWRLVTDRYASASGVYRTWPVFADIDADGDLDLFVGDQRGKLKFYRNGGSPQQAKWTWITDQYEADSIHTSSDACFPVFADLDADGDLDLLVAGGGQFRLYRNVGTAESAAWRLDSARYLDEMDVLSNGLLSIADLDGDGDLDMLSGRTYGGIICFRNLGDAETAAWVQETASFAGIDVNSQSQPSLADIDGDGDLDLFVGDSHGGVSFWRNTTSKISIDPRD